MKLLPPGVSCEKEIIDGTQVYNFRHHKLGRPIQKVFEGNPAGFSYKTK